METLQIKTFSDLQEVKAREYVHVAMRTSAEEAKKYEGQTFRKNVLICGGTGCTSSDSEKLIAKMKEELAKVGLDKEVNVVRTGCFGLCALGPIMIVYPEGSFYSRVKVEDIPRIVEEHLKGGKVVKELLYDETVDGDRIKSLNETTFYAKQKRVALRNCGVINPEDIKEYIAVDGYKALNKVLTEMSREDVIKCVTDSGLRGRGGGEAAADSPPV